MASNKDAAKEIPDKVNGRRGRNSDWPGCTKEFANKTEARRAKNKLAKKSRKKNRSKK